MPCSPSYGTPNPAVAAMPSPASKLPMLAGPAVFARTVSPAALAAERRAAAGCSSSVRRNGGQTATGVI